MTDILTLRQISLTIQGKTLLKDINLSVPKGSFITLAGPSGAGKSTILKICARLLTPSNGELLYNGSNAFSMAPQDYRRHVSYCFQQPVLFGETVADNLNFPFQIRNQAPDQEKQHALLDQVNLPADYLSKSIASLSGGEKQRIALIRNLMFEPDVLLLDEVTTGLDAENKQIVHQLIDNYRQKGTILAITHDQEELTQAEKIVTVEGGQLHE
ncbi:ATP-binding cassette domain-containing protein [Limosilactobacillus mucosae]|uniref:ABC transporter ATP-binding protein n=1 Tax=Limosilactobacillus mucosae TaxID=97478 RepID=UPI0039967C30